MIHQTLAFLAGELGKHLTHYSPAGYLPPVLANPARIPLDTDLEDRLLITLAGLERTDQATMSSSFRRHPEGRLSGPEQLDLNLIITVAANYPQNYEFGLKVLGNAIEFLHQTPIMEPQTHPDLPQNVQRISVEWQNTAAIAQAPLQSLGGQYLPYAMYNLRTLVATDRAPARLT